MPSSIPAAVVSGYGSMGTNVECPGVQVLALCDHWHRCSADDVGRAMTTKFGSWAFRPDESETSRYRGRPLRRGCCRLFRCQAAEAEAARPSIISRVESVDRWHRGHVLPHANDRPRHEVLHSMKNVKARMAMIWIQIRMFQWMFRKLLILIPKKSLVIFCPMCGSSRRHARFSLHSRIRPQSYPQLLWIKERSLKRHALASFFAR